MITAPNLPKKRITLCAAALESKLLSSLNALGIEVLSPVPCPELSDEVSFHADMLICHAGENIIFIEPTQKKLSEKLKALGFSVRFSEILEKKYPGDVKLNFAVSEDFILGNFASADKKLLEYFKESGKKLINVKQGYAKCSLCFVTENAFITEDEAIADVLKNEGKDVLLISKGDIYLSERHYGFFGGASGKISQQTLALTGSIDFHSDKENILLFLKKHSIELYELTHGKIRDIGGILPLTEE
ncbi:MAG: hypothetical protein J1E34_04435 [Oscillospiraceae bacterium]|nr:hypothetical protein [Oscillospiraceae bacterium]